MESSVTKADNGKSSLLVKLKPALRSMLVPVLAVFASVIVGGIVIALAGGNPFDAYLGLAEGSFGSLKALSETTVWATPYIFAGLVVGLAFKGGLFNIGAEGQLALGAVAAAWTGYALPGLLGITFPAIIHIPLTPTRSLFRRSWRSSRSPMNDRQCPITTKLPQRSNWPFKKC